ncbi:Putative nickel-responsive regulator [Candidatus Methanoperedenaceae archaeon GB37]|nr:Putative nickel-responsive regulator [Candidatus Methanoperedenaceae archaeon GB37]
MDSELMRIGVSLPENLLERFDSIISKRGYSSRSEGIRDAIRWYIRYYEWMSNIKGERYGTITLTYNHHQRGLVDEITDIEHEFIGTIQSTLHLHVDENNCFELVVVHGDGERIRELSERLTALKGVKHVKLTTIVPEAEE